MPKFSKEFEELEGLSVKVDDVIYMPNLEAPKDRPHPFVYFISIINRSDQEVRIMGRKWVIEQEKPGDDFTYNSYHVIGDNSRATGSFFGETKNGTLVIARIPDFELRIPQWAEKS